MKKVINLVCILCLSIVILSACKNDNADNSSSIGDTWSSVIESYNDVATDDDADMTAEDEVEEELTQEEYEQGTIVDNVYTSKFIGIRIDGGDEYTLESSYQYDTESANDVLGVNEDVLNDSDDESFTEVVGESENNYNSFNIEVFENPLGDYFIEYYIESFSDIMSAAVENMDVQTGDVYTDFLAGSEYTVIPMETTTYGLEFIQRQYIRVIDDYCVCITFTAESEDDIDNMESLLSIY